MALFGKAASQILKKSKRVFEMDRADEVFIQKLTEQIVEDAAYSLGLNTDNHADSGNWGRENPYYSKDARDVLKYEMNIALRQLEREKEVHLGHGLEKGQKSHPITAFIKAHLFEVVRKEMMSPH